jgi:hypothetical protein
VTVKRVRPAAEPPPGVYQGSAVPEEIRGQWRRWEGAAWRKGVHMSRNQLYPPDQRFSVRPPGGMCRRHLEMRRGYRDMYFDPRKGYRWPGTPTLEWSVCDRDTAKLLESRRCEWDGKASEQMRAIEECCLAGTSPQCEERRTCTGCGLFVCYCGEGLTQDKQ